MKPETQHTPTPYRIVRHNEEQSYDQAAPYLYELWAADGEQPVCKLVDDADATFVTRAVNRDHLFEEMLDALKAIRARIVGDFDNPALMKYGALGDTNLDISAIADEAIAKAEGRA